MLRAVAFLLGAIALTALVHAYLHRRLIDDTELPPPFRRHARLAMLAVAALLPAGMGGLLLMRDLRRSVAAPLMWPAFTWVGLLAFLLPLLLAGEAFRALRREDPRPANPARRRAIARVIAIGSGLLTLGFGGVSAAVAQLAPAVRRLRVPLAGLGVGKSGYKLVQLSDLHVSAMIGRDRVEAVVAAINALEPDLVAITGDLVDGSVRELGPLLSSLQKLRARDGVYFVTGNHEYLSGAEEWLAFLPSLGVRVLRNERVAVGGEGGFDLLGIDDPSGGGWIEGHGPDLQSAVRGRDTSRASVLLAHRPDDVREAARHGIGLQISGHTHGGQIAPVGWALERIHQPFVFGMYEVEGTKLYVTSGAGYWGPPMRLATRAEIALFELVSS